MKQRICPKCGAINAPFKSSMFNHYTETCKNIIGTYRGFLGIFATHRYCNSINVWDEDDDWLYTKESKSEKKKRKKAEKEYYRINDDDEIGFCS